MLANNQPSFDDDEEFDKYIAEYAMNSPETKSKPNPLFMNTRQFNVSTQDYKQLKTFKSYQEEMEQSARESRSPLQQNKKAKIEREGRMKSLNKLLH